jgi:hypothetical protein
MAKKLKWVTEEELQQMNGDPSFGLGGKMTPEMANNLSGVNSMISGMSTSLFTTELASLFDTLQNRGKNDYAINTNSNRVMGMGGETDANAIVESGEMIQLPDGNVGEIPKEAGIHGNQKQGQGAYNFPEGTQIFSDRISIGGEKISDIKKKTAAYTARIHKTLDSRPTDAIALYGAKRAAKQEVAQDKILLETQKKVTEKANMIKQNKKMQNAVALMEMLKGAPQFGGGGKIPSYGLGTVLSNGIDVSTTGPKDLKELLYSNKAITKEDMAIIDAELKRTDPAYAALVAKTTVPATNITDPSEVPVLSGNLSGVTYGSALKSYPEEEMLSGEQDLIDAYLDGSYNKAPEVLNTSDPNSFLFATTTTPSATTTVSTAPPKAVVGKMPPSFWSNSQQGDPEDWVDPVTGLNVNPLPVTAKRGGNGINASKAEGTVIPPKFKVLPSIGEKDGKMGAEEDPMIPLTLGDKMGLAGTGVNLMGGFATTMANAAKTKVPVNPALGKFDDAKRRMSDAWGFLAGQQDLANADILLQEAGDNAKNLGRGYSQVRAGQMANSMIANQARGKVAGTYDAMRAQQLTGEAQFLEGIGRAMMAGDQWQQDAEQANIDNLYSNLSQNLVSGGKTLQEGGAALNTKKLADESIAWASQIGKYVGIDSSRKSKLKGFTPGSTQTPMPNTGKKEDWLKWIEENMS